MARGKCSITKHTWNSIPFPSANYYGICTGRSVISCAKCAKIKNYKHMQLFDATKTWSSQGPAKLGTATISPWKQQKIPASHHETLQRSRRILKIQLPTEHLRKDSIVSGSDVDSGPIPGSVKLWTVQLLISWTSVSLPLLGNDSCLITILWGLTKLLWSMHISSPV